MPLTPSEQNYALSLITADTANRLNDARIVAESIYKAMSSSPPPSEERPCPSLTILSTGSPPKKAEKRTCPTAPKKSRVTKARTTQSAISALPVYETRSLKEVETSLMILVEGLRTELGDMKRCWKEHQSFFCAIQGELTNSLEELHRNQEEIKGLTSKLQFYSEKLGPVKQDTHTVTDEDVIYLRTVTPTISGGTDISANQDLSSTIFTDGSPTTSFCEYLTSTPSDWISREEQHTPIGQRSSSPVTSIPASGIPSFLGETMVPYGEEYTTFIESPNNWIDSFGLTLENESLERRSQ